MSKSGVGGGIGASFRYTLSILLKNSQLSIPLGTVTANFLGCLIIGGLSAIELRSPVLSVEIRLLLATGFCGGLTTMSGFINETIKLATINDYILAAVYVSFTLAGSVFSFFSGIYIVKTLCKL